MEHDRPSRDHGAVPVETRLLGGPDRTPPLAARVRLGRGTAAILTVLVVVAGASALVANGGAGPADLVLVAFVLVLAAAATAVTIAPWDRRLSPAAQELVLLGTVAAPIGGTIAWWAASGAQDTVSLFVLPAVAVASVLTLPHWTQLVLTISTVSVVIGVAVPTGTALEAGYALAATVAAAALADRATVVLAAEIATGHERERDAAHAGRALRAVVDAARTATTGDPQEVLDAVVRATVHLDSEMAGAYLVEDDGVLRLAAWIGMPDELVTDPVLPDEGIVGQAINEGRLVVSNEYAEFEGARPTFVAAGLRSAIAVPIIVDGTTVGVLAAGRRRGGGYDAAATTALELLADHASRALALARAIDEDRQLLQRLRALNELQEDFVATVSHELRTPLTVVDGLAATLEHRFEELDPAHAVELLGRLRANSTALTTIVTSLLEAARLDRGLVEVDASPVALDELLVRCVDRLAPVLEDHRVTLDVEPASWVLADADLIERVVDNILTNARRHTPAGTTVTISTGEVEDRVVVTVRDDGPGIAAADLGRIADRFTRGGDLLTRRAGGLGLGLSLADQILRLHGTRLRVASPPGSGAEFRFALPSTRARTSMSTATPATRGAVQE